MKPSELEFLESLNIGGIDYSNPETSEERRKRLEKEKLEDELNLIEDDKIDIEESIEPIAPEAVVEENNFEEDTVNKMLSEESSDIKFLRSLNIGATEYEPEKVSREIKDSSVIGDDISLARQFQYGAALEPHIIGNTYRLVQAAFTKKSNETFSEAAQRIEAARVKEILKQFPEFVGKEESLEVLSGRLGMALADPVTLLVPWVKIAKAGKIANVGITAGIAGADMALREKALYGEINPVMVGISSTIGGITGGLSKVIADRVAKKTIQEGTKKGAGKKVIDEGEETLNLDEATRKLVGEAGEDATINSQKNINSWVDSTNSLGEKYTKLDLFSTEIAKIKKQIRTNKDAVEIKKLETKVKKIEKNKKILSAEIDKVQYIDIPEQSSIIGFNSLMSLAKKIDPKTGKSVLDGQMGKSFIHALVQETVRPAVGGIGGGLTYLGLSDDADDTGLNQAIAAGVVIGFLNKRIENSTFKLSNKTKDTISGEIENTLSKHYKVFFKSLFASTHSAKLQANNDVLAGFGKSLFKVQGDSVDESIETAAFKYKDFFRRELFKITGSESDETIAAAGRIIQQKNMSKNSKYSFLDKGDMANIKAVEIAGKFNVLQNNFKNYVKQTGIEFKEIESYGLTQVFNTQAADALGVDATIKILTRAFKIQNINANKLDPKANPLFSEEKLKKQAVNYFENSDGIRRKEMLDSKKFKDESTEVLNPKNKKRKAKTIINSARFFDNKRVLVDQEARASAKDLFVQDLEFTANSLFENSIPVAEFARKFGSKGQGLANIRKQLKNYYIQKSKEAGGTGDFTKDKGLRQLYNNDLELISKSVNGFFGVHGLNSSVKADSGWKTAMLTTQALLSTTKLYKVVIPSMGDLIQVYQNSGVKPFYQSMIRQVKERGPDAKKPSAELGLRSGRIKEGVFGRQDPISKRAWKNKKYNGVLEQELKNFSMTASTKYQRSIVNFQKRFFEIVQLGRLTRFAREFAYDAGAFRAFDIGKIKNLSRSRRRELKSLGLTVDNAKYLSKFKTMDEAYEDSIGKILIDKAGRSAADRDALIPTVGNRLLFAQAEDPLQKFAGSFLSWAMAKGSQTNSLIRRMEDGDAKLALLALSTIPIYASVQQLQVDFNPNIEFREKESISPADSAEDFWKWTGKGAMFSGQMMPFWMDKAINSIKYNSSLIDTVYPAASIVNDLYEVGKDVASLPSGEKTGSQVILKLFETLAPGGKEVTRREIFGDAIGLSGTIKEEVDSFATGGLVEGEDNVTDTEENPADRTNPYTGESYAETSKGVLAALETRQAERKPLNRGGLLNKLKSRKAYGVGGALTKIATELLKKLPKKVYHGGTKNVRESESGTEGIFVAADKLHADSFASKDAIARQALTGDKLKNISKEDFDLSEINISSVKNPYVLDAPDNLVKRQIEKDLMETPDLKDSKFNALMALLNPEEYNLKVNSNNFYTIKDEAAKYLKSKGYDIVLDTDTIKKGIINNPEAELFVLQKFPAKKVDRIAVPTKK